MNIQELLKWTDDRLLANTGKHLDSLQKAILEGIWQHQNYEEIAANNHRTYDHVKREAWKLWKILSETLGEEVKKSNVISVLENQILSNNFSNLGERVQIVGTLNGNINICGDNGIAPSTPDSPEGKEQTPIIDLKDAPELIDYCEEHRSSELAQLGEWISAGTRLIAIYGLSGIGKSAIAVNLVAETSSQFDCVIWRSLGYAPTLSALKAEIKQIFAPLHVAANAASLSDYFRNYRCLLVLDDLENIFKSGQLAGQYSSGYEGYGKFFKQIATSSSSCLILLTWEKPRDIATLEGDKRSARSLHLKGLGEGAVEILREKGLRDEESWPELISLYRGHPCWLNIIAATILELFNGSVSRFLAEKDSNIFIGDLEPLLESHLERLSDLEIRASNWLAGQAEAVDIARSPSSSDLSKSELWQAIQSLGRRGLVEKVQVGEGAMFQLNPVFQQYIQSVQSK